MTKLEFLKKLEKELERFGVVDKSEILADFEQHFADSKNLGTNEAEICAKLGDISEIAKQYAEEEIFPAIAVDTGVAAGGNPASPPPVQKESFSSQNADTSGFDNAGVNPSGFENGGTPYENSGIRIDFGQFKKNNANNNPPPPAQTHFSTAQNPPPTNQHTNYNNQGVGGTASGGTPPPQENVRPLSQDDNINSYYGPNGETQPPPPPRSYSDYANSGFRINSENFSVSGLITVILVDIFVLSWAMVAFFGVTVGLLAVPVSFVVAGIATAIGGAFINIFSFYTPVSTLATLFLGIAFLSAGGLLTLAGVGLIKLFVKAVKGIINWHGKMITGRPVFEPKTKRKGANAQ